MTLRVVVADDEPIAASALAFELQRLGCEVVAITGTGDAAIAACLEHRPQLCVTDVAMPGRDGLAVARALRTAAPDIRVVFVTAHPHYAVEAFAEEVIDFVPKPVRRARLADAIARVRRSMDWPTPSRACGARWPAAKKSRAWWSGSAAPCTC